MNTAILHRTEPHRPTPATTKAPQSTAQETPMLEVSDIVIGTGPLGRAVATALAGQGRQPLLVNRSGNGVPGHRALGCADGDLAAALPASADGQSLRIFVCAAPAYHRWPQEFPALVESIRRATQGRRCDIVYADNLYAYGPSSDPYTEDMPSRATTVKGRVRAEVARQLLALHQDAGPVRVAIVRGSTFFGPGVENSALGGPQLRAVLDGKPVPLLGDPGQPHTVTYLPDFARCMLRVAEAPQFMGHTWHVPNSETRSLRQWLADFAAAGSPAPRERVAGRTLLRLFGLFNPTMREMVEMMYQFEQPLRVDHRRSAAALGLQATPARDAVAATKVWLRSA